MDRNQLLQAMLQYRSNNPITHAGEYWSQDNAQYEQTQPSFGSRVARSMNPMSGFGSAMGAMHDGASKGSFGDMGIAALQALPMFGVLKAIATPAKGAIKAGLRDVPSLARTLAFGGAGAVAGALTDTAQASNERQYGQK